MLATCHSFAFPLNLFHTQIIEHCLSFANSKRHLSKNFSLRHRIDLSLYLVTERTYVNSEEEFFFKIKRAIKGGVTCVQLRDRHEDLQDSLKTAYRLKEMLNSRGVPLMINNRIDVALAVNAEGIHIGQKDFPYREARRLLGPRAIIGLTVNTLDDVLAAEEFDVDYLGVQILPSEHTKPNHTRVWGIEGLKQIRSISSHRLVAIGGIHLHNLEKIYSQIYLGSQDDGIAMVGELWRADDPCVIAQKIQTIFNEMKASQTKEI